MIEVKAASHNHTSHKSAEVQQVLQKWGKHSVNNHRQNQNRNRLETAGFVNPTFQFHTYE